MQHEPVSISDISEDALLRHSKRPQWGLGYCLERTEHNWTLQFQDGKLRKLGVQFLNLFEIVTLPMDERERVLEELTTAAGVSLARATVAAEGGQLVTFEQQLQVFRHMYPEGFDDPKWISEVRGGQGRRVKRQREPAIADAQEQLALPVLKKLVADGYLAEVIERIDAVLTKTSLITKKQLEPLRGLTPPQQRTIVDALMALLAGEPRFDKAHRSLIQALDAVHGASWPLATAVTALLAPKEHVCVAPTTFRKQAQWMAPDLPVSNVPNANVYQHLATMVDSVHEKLIQAKLTPRDLFDVTDFMWCTLRPNALKLIKTLPSARSQELANKHAADGTADSKTAGKADDGKADDGKADDDKTADKPTDKSDSGDASAAA